MANVGVYGCREISIEMVIGTRGLLTEEGFLEKRWCPMGTEACWNSGFCLKRGRGKEMSEALSSLPRRGSWHRTGW